MYIEIYKCLRTFFYILKSKPFYGYLNFQIKIFTQGPEMTK